MIPLLPPVPAVTLDLRATSLAEALPRLGKAFGVPMRAAPAIGDEIVILSLKAVTPNDFEAKLAATFAAEWRTAPDGTLVLDPSPAARRDEKRAFFAGRESRARRLIAALVTEAKEAMPVDGALLDLIRWTKLETEAGRKPKIPADIKQPISPERRLLDGLVAALRPAELTGLDSRVVFATAANPMQRPLPSGTGPLITRFERERAIYRQVVLESGIDPEDAPKATMPLAGIQLIVESSLESLAIELRVYDVAGKSIAQEGEETPLVSDDRTKDAEQARTSEEPEPQAEGTRFPASAESKAFTAALGYGQLFGPGRDAGATRELAPPFLDVVTRDPLSYALSDAAFEAGRLTGRSVLVRPRDDAISVGQFVGTDATLTIPEALAVPGVDLSAPGWLVARPLDPYLIPLAFFPRSALRDALAAAYDDGRLSLPSALRIADLTPETGFEPPLIALPHRLALARTVLNLPLLRTLNALGTSGRRRAEGGISFEEVPPEAQRRLRRLIFGLPRIALRGPTPLPGFTNLPSLSDLDGEPTAVLPNGIPDDALLTVTTVLADGFVPSDESLRSGRPITMEQLGVWAYQNDHPNLFPAAIRTAAARWTTVALRRAGRETTTLRLDLDARHAVSGSHISYGAPTGPEFRISTLPADLRPAFERALALAEARFRDAIPDASGDDPTPNPP